MMEMMVELLNKSKVYMMHDVNPVYLHSSRMFVLYAK